MLEDGRPSPTRIAEWSLIGEEEDEVSPTRSFSFSQGPEMTMELSPRRCRLYIAVTDYEQRPWGRKGLIASIIVGRQGRNLSRAGT